MVRAAFALASLPGVGRRRLRVLLARARGRRLASPENLCQFVASCAADLKLHISPSVADRAWAAAEALVDACRRRNWRVWILGEPDYPEGLLRLDDPPALLFFHGAEQPAARVRIAVIGTREPSRWGEATAAECGAAAAHAGAIVVSGLAWGVDTAAHAAVVSAKGCTWAVLPCGLDLVFPPSNAALAERIVGCGGALVSEYFPGTRPHPTFFVERDRLQAALSRAVVVVETGLSGGTMHTVRFARQLGVPLHVTWPDAIDPARVDRVEDLPEPQQGPWTLLRDASARIVVPAAVPGLVRALAGAVASSHAGDGHDGTPGAQGRLFS